MRRTGRFRNWLADDVLISYIQRVRVGHWSDLEQLPDLPENYRNWTLHIESRDPGVVLSVSEDNIPDETKRARSDEFWSGVLSTIKAIVEARTSARPRLR